MISPIHDTTPPASLSEQREKAVRRLRAGGPPPVAPCVPLYRDGITHEEIEAADEAQDIKRAPFSWLPIAFYISLPVLTGAYALYRVFTS